MCVQYRESRVVPYDSAGLFLQKTVSEDYCSLEGNKGGIIAMAEEKIGEVMKFFAKPCVAAVKIINGELRVGDTIRITGHTTDITSKIESMEVDNQKVEKATAGNFIGVKVSDRVRPGDEVFRVTPE